MVGMGNCMYAKPRLGCLNQTPGCWNEQRQGSESVLFGTMSAELGGWCSWFWYRVSTHTHTRSPGSSFIDTSLFTKVAYSLINFAVVFLSRTVHSVTLLLNLLACLAWFTDRSERGVDFGLSILWFIIFTPCAFLCWYRPAYKAFRQVPHPRMGN